MSCELLLSGRCVCQESRVCVFIGPCCSLFLEEASLKHHQRVMKQALSPSGPDRKWGRVWGKVGLSRNFSLVGKVTREMGKMPEQIGKTGESDN